MNRAALIAEARTWLGTPYHHQAASKGVGCDCIGLIRALYERFVGTLPVTADYSPQWHLHQSEERLYAEVSRYGLEIALHAAQPGAVLLFGFGKGPAAHAGVLVSDTTFIHAYAEIGKVAESRLSDKWQARLRYAFQFPGLA